MTNENKTEKQPIAEPIPLTLSQYKCVLCEKMFYINIDDKTEDGLVCPFCNDTDVPNIREFDMNVLGIGEVNEVN